MFSSMWMISPQP